MALVLKRLYTGYFWIFDELADPRASKYVALSTPFVPFAIIWIYLYFTRTLGPKFMENRKPFVLKNVIIFYNALQIIFNLMLEYQLWHVIKHMIPLGCNMVDYTEKGEYALAIAYKYHLLKILDLMDTVFMVLRKNTRQITFLHLYHHAGMVGATYLGSNFFGGGELAYTCSINLAVHAVMYLYYLLVLLDRKWKENSSIKKFITQIQLVQFMANILIYGRLFFMPDCHYPRFVPLIYVPQNIFMLALFLDFYIKTYVLKESKKEVKK